MNKTFRGVVGLTVPFLLAAACSAAPNEQGDGTGDDPMTGGTGGNAGSGTSGAQPTGGVTNGGTTSGGGVVGSGGAMSTGGVTNGGTTSSGGVIGSGGTVSTGGTLGTGGTNMPPTGGTGPGGMAGTASGGTSTGGTAGVGMGGRGGTAGSAGKGGTAGSAGKGGSAGSGTGGATGSSCTTWPTATGSQSVSSSIRVTGTYDGALKRFVGSGPLGSGGQQEGQQPLFDVQNGGTLKNVIIGNPAADGVHCEGSCTLENVWWEDVGEDAATFKGASGTMTVHCGGAKNATDKVFQHNGGGTLTIQDFTVNTFGKLYRSCGNCPSQPARHVVLQNITARTGSTLVGINTNYGDTADFDNITVYGRITICERYTGNTSGAEPVKTGSGPDTQYCRYTTADITQL